MIGLNENIGWLSCYGSCVSQLDHETRCGSDEFDAPASAITRAAPVEQLSPKHIQAQKEGKIPYEYLVWEVLADDAAVHKHGADKYGVRNWLVDRILASTYEGAMMRHFLAWARGEDIDPDSGKPHLIHLRACCAVVESARRAGTLIDDRQRADSKRPTQEPA